ncbi:MAG: AbrB/MazE/SpoVT family DNA-binding domain-containing protein [Lachnospiraceae bacterium]|nr:AbrB/MazE/SpoVT family DNA-binding domain-containing protein [Lachnospiraceae bacterium]
MKSTGIVRRLDELGRITIPIELRRTLDIEDRESLEIYVEDEKIILQKYLPVDIFTGSRQNLIEYKGKKISKESIEEMARLVGLIK